MKIINADFSYAQFPFLNRFYFANHFLDHFDAVVNLRTLLPLLAKSIDMELLVFSLVGTEEEERPNWGLGAPLSGCVDWRLN